MDVALGFLLFVPRTPSFSQVCANGKIFHKTRKLLPHKTINEIITFFYAWKASSHYHMWKKFKRNTYKVVGEEQRRKIQDKMEGFS
mmetsp:Transcript_27165/g.43120  ORF Transcript_27165/g.43120 Transcript_27165/m.43120 type:complete len:86 (+) Transcript_27165:476-733(+)